MKCKLLNDSISIQTTTNFNGRYLTSHFSKDNSYSYFRKAELNDKHHTHFTIPETQRGEGEFKDFHISVVFNRSGNSKGKIYYSKGNHVGTNLNSLSPTKQKTFKNLIANFLDEYNAMALEFWEKLQYPKEDQAIANQLTKDTIQRYEALKVKSEIEQNLLMKKGVIGIDIDYKIKDGQKTDEIALVVFVKEKGNVPKSQFIPKTISGVKTDIWEANFSSFSSLPQRSKEKEAIKSSHNLEPLTGGISIGTFCEENSGTLGAVLPTNFGFPVMLSCMHVLADSPHSIDGDPISQPSLAHGGFYPNSSAGQMLRGFIGQPYNIDAAIATISDRLFIENHILCLGKIGGITDSKLNETVAKYGLTSKITTGTVVSKTLSCKVQYPSFGERIFYNQLRIQSNAGNTPFALAGDSGSLLVNDSKEAVGMVIAGGIAPEGKYYTIANPMRDIVNFFEKNGVHLI